MGNIPGVIRFAVLVLMLDGCIIAPSQLGGKLSLLFRHYANQGPRKDQLTAYRFYRVVQDLRIMGKLCRIDDIDMQHIPLL